MKIKQENYLQKLEPLVLENKPAGQFVQVVLSYKVEYCEAGHSKQSNPDM